MMMILKNSSNGQFTISMSIVMMTAIIVLAGFMTRTTEEIV
jgi:hypothetical protein